MSAKVHHRRPPSAAGTAKGPIKGPTGPTGAGPPGPVAKAEQDTFTIRPNFAQKFRAAKVKPMLQEVLQAQLMDKEFDVSLVDEWSTAIKAETLKRLRADDLERYKLIVQVVLGEQKTAAAKMLCKCHWDSDTDNYAQELFMNNSLFCVLIVYGVFYY